MMDSNLASQGAASQPTRKRNRMGRMQRSEAITGWLFVAPWVIGFLAFTLGPMLFSLYASFTEYGITTAPKWIGLQNFREIFTADRFFWISLKNTFWMVLVNTPLIIILSLVIALLLNMELPGSSFFRTMIYLPAVLSGVASIFLWEWILSPDGLFNQGLSLLGIRGPAWFTDATWTKPALVIMGLWWIGTEVVIYLAALKGIDKTLYEAAKIDGASFWAQSWFITLPLLSPTTFFLVITNVIGIFQIFSTAYIITTDPAVPTVGGPEHSLLFYVLYLYKRAFGQQVGSGTLEMGYASALAWILFMMILAITLLQLWLSKRWVHYEA
jgi:multiple sugar transport system permease protein